MLSGSARFTIKPGEPGVCGEVCDEGDAVRVERAEDGLTFETRVPPAYKSAARRGSMRGSRFKSPFRFPSYLLTVKDQASLWVSLWGERRP